MGENRDELRGRLRTLGEEIGRREAEHGAALDQAQRCADRLYERVARGLEAFHEAASEAGAPHLRAALSEPRPDDKHLRSIQFDLTRGRHRAIVTVKSRGEVTLVGPFHIGKTEGPCKSFPWDAELEIDGAVVDFLERFLAEGATP